MKVLHQDHEAWVSSVAILHWTCAPMKMAVLLWASLALALGYARGTVSSDENAPSLLLPWDVPSKYVVRAVAGVSCTRYDFDVEHTLEEVQVFIVQAVIHPLSCFGHFMGFFGFSYNATEYFYRLKLWESNLRAIYHHNMIDKDGGFWDINQFTVFTAQEAADYIHGSKFLHVYPECPDLPTAENSPDPAPASWDWRQKGFVTPVTYQSGGSCWAHAAANFVGSYVLKNRLSSAIDNSTIVSPQTILDCFPAKATLKNRVLDLYNRTLGPCYGGGEPDDALRYIQARPVPLTTNAAFPYVPGQGNDVCSNPKNPLCQAYPGTSSPQYFLPDTTRMTLRNCALTEDQLKQAVYTLGPLVIGMSAGDTKYLQNYNNDELISGRTDKYCNTTSDGSLDINHGVLVVGYQESTVLANGTAIGGSFIIKNSWGIAWGLAGYGYYAFSDATSKYNQSSCGVADSVIVPSI